MSVTLEESNCERSTLITFVKPLNIFEQLVN